MGAVKLEIHAEEIRAGGSICVLNQLNYYAQPQAPPAGSAEPTDLVPQFETVKEYLNHYDPKTAIAVLERLESENGSRFTNHTHFRFLAYKGHALRLAGDFEPAARCFLKAKQFRPDTEDASALEILAHILLRNDTKAFELASEARTTFGESVHIASAWLQCSPSTLTIDELEAGIPTHLRSDSSVALGLALAALKRQNPSKAVSYSKTATDKAPDWLEAKSLWATAVIAAQGEANRPHDSAVLAAACAALQQCIDVMRSQCKPDEVAQQCVNLAVGYRLSGDQEAADDAMSLAHRLAPTNEEIRIPYALSLLNGGKIDEAISSLDHQINSQSQRVRVIWAQMRAQRNRDGDRDLALATLKDVAARLDGQEPELAASALDTLAKLYLDRKDPSSAQVLLNGEVARKVLPEFQRLVLLAKSAQIAGRREDAVAIARSVAADYLSDASQEDGESLAILLEALEEKELALETWKRAVTPTSPINTARHVMALALQQREEQYALDLGREFRAANIFDLGLIDMELGLLRAISLMRYEKLLKELLNQVPDGSTARYLRALQSHLGMQINRDDLIERDISRLPHIDEIREDQCPLVVTSLKRADPIIAIEIAYSLVRRFPESASSYCAMICSVFDPEYNGPRPALPEVSVGGIDSAVHLEFLPGSERHWFVIENGTELRPLLNEIGRENPIAKAVEGKKKDDEVQIDDAFGTKRQARIVEIVHKWAYRIRYCTEQLPVKFPGQQFIRRFSFDASAPPLEAFREVLAFLDSLQTRDSDVLSSYLKTPELPLHVLSTTSNKPLISIMSQLTARSDGRIRCCLGTPQELARAESDLASSSAIVIEATALGTMLLLDQTSGAIIYDEIEKWSRRPIVAEGSVEELERVLEMFSSDAARIGVARVSGALVPRLTSSDEVNQISSSVRPKIERLLHTVRTKCEIVAGSTLSDIPAPLRGDLVRVFGRAAIESVQLARSREALLWTDDSVFAQISGHQLGCKRTWTQKICADFICKDRPNLFRQATLGLLSMRYEATMFAFDDVLSAASQVNWKVNAMPFMAILDCLAQPAIQPQLIIDLAASLLKAVWSNPLLETQAVEVTQRILDRLGTRSDGQALVMLLHRDARTICNPVESASNIIGPHVIAAANLRRVIENWLAFNQAKQIIRPLDWN